MENIRKITENMLNGESFHCRPNVNGEIVEVRIVKKKEEKFLVCPAMTRDNVCSHLANILNQNFSFIEGSKDIVSELNPGSNSVDSFQRCRFSNENLISEEQYKALT